MDTELEIDPSTVNGTGPKVIKMNIFQDEPGENDLEDGDRTEHEGSIGMTMHTELEIYLCKVDGTGPKVVKMNNFQAESRENDLDDDDKTEDEGSTGVTMDTELDIDPCTGDGPGPKVIKMNIFQAEPGEDNFDDDDKTEDEGSTGMTMDTELDIDPCTRDGPGPKIIKMNIFQAEPGEDDLVDDADKSEHEGSTGVTMDTELDIGPCILDVTGNGEDDLDDDDKMEDEGSTMDTELEIDLCTGDGTGPKVIRMKNVQAEPGEDDFDVAEITGEDCIEVVVGEEGTAVTASASTVCEQQMDDSKNKIFISRAWTAAEGITSDETENQNGTASAGMHMNDSAGHDMRRLGSRQYPTAIIIGPDGHPMTVYPCMCCEKKFKSKGFLKMHIRYEISKLAKKKLHCTDCDYTTTNKSTFLSHLKSHKLKPRAEKVAKCDECGKHFSHAGALFKHKLVHREKGARKIHKCKFCEYETTDRALLNRHLLEAHSKNFPYVCAECGRGFRHPSRLKIHILTHTGEKPHKCQYCEYKSAYSSNLKAHVKTKHSKEMPSKSFSDTKEVKQHASLHEESKPYQCLHCNYSSSHSQDLKRHTISSHTKDYPHKCDMCGKCFHRPSQLMKHMGTHKGKTYLHQCRHCDFKIEDPFMLTRHILSVHIKDPPFKCMICKEGFRHENGLKKHMKTHSEPNAYQSESCECSMIDASRP